MSTESTVEELKKLAEEAQTDKPTDAKEYLAGLDQGTRNMVGLAATMKLIVNRAVEGQLDSAQQMDIIQTAISYYRNTVVLEVFEVLMPQIIKALDEMKPGVTATKTEEMVGAILSESALLCMTLADDASKDQRHLKNLLDMLKPSKTDDADDEESEDTQK